jgi:hypothetical protein
MSRRLFHLRTLEKRREKRHEYFSWLMKNWVYTISYLLTHLSYKNRNIYNSTFWTIWLRWCFLRSKRLCHLFWIRFELFSCCNFFFALSKACFQRVSQISFIFDNCTTRSRTAKTSILKSFWITSSNLISESNIIWKEVCFNTLLRLLL